MKKIIGGLIALALIIGAAWILYSKLGDKTTPNQIQSEAEEKTEENRAAAPDFEVVDKDGKTVRLSDYKGKPVVLNFWASWCPPCKSEMPDFDEVYKSDGENVVFLMVNLTDGSRETVKTASDYVQKQGYSFPIVYDTKGSAANAYGVRSIPNTYFIDKNGNIARQKKGALDRETLQKGINLILEYRDWV